MFLYKKLKLDFADLYKQIKLNKLSQNTKNKEKTKILGFKTYYNGQCLI
jgi:hypothetical protein